MRTRTVFAALALAAGLVLAQGNPADDHIYDQVRMKMANDADVGGNAIDVEVHGGVVTLKGKVSKGKQKTKAEHLARKVKGVKNVVNDLVVAP
jgi:hyperosmotically inducible periplasmic protein